MKKHDLFISYARADNRPEWLNGFVETLKARHRAFTDRELNVFFDEHEILIADQWRHDILGALRDSAFMLAVVSPNYFASPFCRWEFDEFVSREFERFAVGEAIGPVYWIEVPGFPNDQLPDPWQADISRRNVKPPVPLRRWEEGLEESLRERDVAQKLATQADQIARTVKERLDRRDRAAASPTNLDNAVSPNFVGRARELVKVHESLAFGAVGAITSVQGIGGIGKTELAFAYATAYAHEYPGGRWLVACEGRTDVREALADAMAVRWTIPARSADVTTEMRWEVFLQALDTHGKSLFVLDNVSEDAFLAADQLKRLPGHGRAAFLVTTRLGCPPRPGELDVLDLDRLDTGDGVALLRRFRSEAESAGDFEILRGIVEKVGGHALALEAIGVYLRENTRVTLPAYKAWFDAELLKAVGALADDPAQNKTRHGEVLIPALLEPTLARLDDLALQAAQTAAFLPPDAVYEPWLREIVVGNRAELLAPGHLGPKSAWECALDDLAHLLLLRFQGPTGRMHRLVGEVLRAASPATESVVDSWVAGRVNDLLENPRDIETAELDALEAWASAEAATTRARAGFSTPCSAVGRTKAMPTGFASDSCSSTKARTSNSPSG